VTTEPFLKSYRLGSSHLQPMKPPRRCARYTNFMACDLHTPMCSHLAVSRRQELHHCRRLYWVESRAIHDGMATKNTTYNWVCKPHTIYIQYDPNVHLSKNTRCFANSNIKMPSVVLDVFSLATTRMGEGETGRQRRA
jgi:hypothetical protein